MIVIHDTKYSVRDEYHCAANKIYEAGTDFGCKANAVSYESWFASWNTHVQCVKLKQYLFY